MAESTESTTARLAASFLEKYPVPTTEQVAEVYAQGVNAKGQPLEWDKFVRIARTQGKQADKLIPQLWPIAVATHPDEGDADARMCLLITRLRIACNMPTPRPAAPESA